MPAQEGVYGFNPTPTPK